MMHLKHQYRTYLWAASLLTLCGFILYEDNKLNGCQGLLHIFGDLFLWVIVVILLILFLGRQVYQFAKNVENKKVRLILSALVLLVFALAGLGKTTWTNIRLGKATLKAAIYPDQLDIGRLTLFDTHTYSATYGHIDWSCSYTNTYKIIGDTLLLEGHPYVDSDGIIAELYLITDSTLTPIHATKGNAQRAQAMKIEPID